MSWLTSDEKLLSFTDPGVDGDKLGLTAAVTAK
jgi:hypothetical protein